jgi:uncharacterized protein YggE
LRVRITALLSTVTLAGAVAVAALAASSRPPVAAAADDLRSTITVVGDGRVLVQPDIALASFGVEATGQTLTDAQAQASTRMQAVVDTLTGLGISRDDIRTSRLSASPIYDQMDASIIRGYRADNSVQVKLRQIDQVGAIVDAITSAGANRVDGLSFAVDNLETLACPGIGGDAGVPWDRWRRESGPHAGVLVAVAVWCVSNSNGVSIPSDECRR